jgi:hypothetical protein
MIDEIQERLDLLINRLRTTYDGIGHSSGRPYIYFVYPPSQELEVQRRARQCLKNEATLTFHHIDILPLTIESMQGKEEVRQQHLNTPQKTENAAEAILRIWTRRIGSEIKEKLAETRSEERPVVVLHNLAALHPLGNPTSLMEFLAEQEPRNPLTGTIIPIVALVPGSRPPQSSRLYLFLDQERLRLDFYRGEEI